MKHKTYTSPGVTPAIYLLKVSAPFQITVKEHQKVRKSGDVSTLIQYKGKS